MLWRSVLPQNKCSEENASFGEPKYFLNLELSRPLEACIRYLPEFGKVSPVTKVIPMQVCCASLTHKRRKGNEEYSLTFSHASPCNSIVFLNSSFSEISPDLLLYFVSTLNNNEDNSCNFFSGWSICHTCSL